MEVRTRNPQSSPWTDLPTELLTTIANTLTSNPIDILTFRSVCNSWRTSFPPLSDPSLLSPLLPLPIPAPPFFRNRHGKQSILTVTVIYSIRLPVNSSVTEFSPCTLTNWFLFLDEYTPGRISLRKPFRRFSYSLPVNFPKTIDLVDFNAIELCRFYSLSYSKDDPRFITEDLDKVVLFPNRVFAIALFSDGYLAIIRLDLGIGSTDDDVWKVIHDKGCGFRFDDIVEFKGRVLGIDRRARVYEICYPSFKIKSVVPPIAGGGGRRKRLVESSGLLYMVVRCNADKGKMERKTGVKVREGDEKILKTKFKVYELDERRNKWVEISGIGERSFIFGIDFSFSASVRELGTCGKNCILFKRGSFLSYNTKDDDAKLFDKLENPDLYVAVCHLNEVDHCDVVESYPGYSDMLWPPPPWIWSVDRFTRLGMLETAIDEIFQRFTDNIKAKTKEQTVQEAGNSSDDFQQNVTYVRTLLKVKEEVTSTREFEPNFMYEWFIYKTLKEAASTLGLELSTDMMNEVYKRVIVQARTASHGTVERLECPDELQSDTDTDTNSLSDVLLPYLLEHDAYVFRLEERVGKMVRFPKARLAPLQTD